METLAAIASRYALPAVSVTLGAMYLDGKHHIIKDINTWRQKRRFKTALAENAKLMGDYFTLYHAIEHIDPQREAFHFEGRSWTFGEVREEADKLAQWFLDQGIHAKGILHMSKTEIRFCCCLHAEFGGSLLYGICVVKIGRNQRYDQQHVERYLTRESD